MITFAVVGGDSRQLRLAELLRHEGSRVNLAAFERSPDYGNKCMDFADAVHVSDCIVLPAPSFTAGGQVAAPLSDVKVGRDELLRALEPGSLVVGGMLGEDFLRDVKERGCKAVDILKREDFAIANGITTAEGAIQIAMEELPITIDGSRCLITGAGRIGKQLAIKLRALGAQVTITARRAGDLAFCESLGVNAQDTAKLPYLAPGKDVIFNTIPERVFDQQVLNRVDTSCLCIDLASVPGGFDKEAAQERGLRVNHALSLPGKVAPVTSARNLKKVIGRILSELESAP